MQYNLLTFARTIDDPDVRQLSRSHVEEWLSKVELSPASTRTRLSQVHGFAAWAIEHGLLKKDPTIGVRRPREPRRLPRGLPGEDIARLLEYCPDNRGRLIVLLMTQEGLRRKEVAGLQFGDIDRDERMLLVRGKGGHERVLPISDETWRVLLRYLAEHPAKAGPLVRSYHDGRSPLSAVTIGRIVSEWMFATDIKQAPYDGRSAHSCRHTMATDMLKAGAHIRDVQAALGHRSIVTTQRYLPLLVNDLRDAMGGRRYQR